MNEVLAQRLDSILAFIEGSVKTGAAFAAEQVPDVINQFLMWGLISAGMMVFFSLLIAGFLHFYGKKCVDMYNKKEDKKQNCYQDNSGWVGAAIVFHSIEFVFVAILLYNLFTATKIYVAPKVYLLEYASSLLTQAQ